MSTYYRPVRRGPARTIVVAVAALVVLPLFIWAGVLHAGHSLWSERYIPDAAAEQRLPGCAYLADWSLQWTIWDGWYCHDDSGRGLHASAALPTPAGDSPLDNQPTDVPGWLVFFNPGSGVQLNVIMGTDGQPEFSEAPVKIVHVRSYQWMPSGTMEPIVEIVPWKGRPYRLSGPAETYFVYFAKNPVRP